MDTFHPRLRTLLFSCLYGQFAASYEWVEGNLSARRSGLGPGSDVARDWWRGWREFSVSGHEENMTGSANSGGAGRDTCHTSVTADKRKLRDSWYLIWFARLHLSTSRLSLSLSFTLMEFSVIIIWDETRIIAKYIVAHLYANSVGLFTTMSVTFYIYQKLWKALIVTNKEASRDSAGCLVSDLKAARIEIITENVGTSHQSS